MPIQIVEYDPAWPAAFETEAERLRRALDGVALRIEHVGSTSVQGLAARPVIDIQISVARLDPAAPYREPLEALGYHYETSPVRFFHRPAVWPHTHHVHVREAGTPDERRTIAFRDWLRRDADNRRAYEALKRRLAAHAESRTGEDRARYSNAKTDFIRAAERATDDA